MTLIGAGTVINGELFDINSIVGAGFNNRSAVHAACNVLLQQIKNQKSSLFNDKLLTSRKYVNWISIPWPTLELPSWTLNKHGYHTIP
jgi:hypothetical protein